MVAADAASVTSRGGRCRHATATGGRRPSYGGLYRAATGVASLVAGEGLAAVAAAEESTQGGEEKGGQGSGGVTEKLYRACSARDQAKWTYQGHGYNTQVALPRGYVRHAGFLRKTAHDDLIAVHHRQGRAPSPR